MYIYIYTHICLHFTCKEVYLYNISDRLTVAEMALFSHHELCVTYRGGKTFVNVSYTTPMGFDHFPKCNLHEAISVVCVWVVGTSSLHLGTFYQGRLAKCCKDLEQWEVRVPECRKIQPKFTRLNSKRPTTMQDESVCFKLWHDGFKFRNSTMFYSCFLPASARKESLAPVGSSSRCTPSKRVCAGLERGCLKKR